MSATTLFCAWRRETAPRHQSARSHRLPDSLTSLALAVFLFFQPKFFRKTATEHYQPPEETGQKEYEVPMLDEQAYVMQVWFGFVEFFMVLNKSILTETVE